MRRTVLALWFLMLGCSVPTPTAARPALLPDRAGEFTASELVSTPDFVRRSYRRGNTEVGVTVAFVKMNADQLKDWRRQGAVYRQADLGIPPELGTGFFTCSDADERSCDLHVQLAAGYHVEIMGGGKASRADLEALRKDLPLKALASTPR